MPIQFDKMADDLNLRSMIENSQNELSAAMANLESHLKRVEEELDLECAEVSELLGQKNPEFDAHLRKVGQSLNDLRDSMNEVRKMLPDADASQTSTQPQAMDKSNVAQGESFAGVEHAKRPDQINPDENKVNKPEDMESNDGDLTPQAQSHIRHDEKVTIGGIFRALLMADEPLQRQEWERKK